MSISGAARLAGVMGWPIAHSRSPHIHGYWLERYRIDGAYVPLAIRPEHLAEAFAALPKVGFRGWNITLPHKEAARRLVDSVTPAAERIGAVNTVTVQADGSLSGDNTDAFGFLAHIDQSVPDWPRARPALVLGAGGAARAVIFALLEAGVPEVRLCNRTLARAEALAADNGPAVRPVRWEDREAAMDGAGLVVNTTSLGMHGQPPLEVRLEALPVDAVVNDIVYVPLETPLLAAAAARGLRTVDGLGMLLHQARPGFERWFGHRPEVTPDLHATIVRDLLS
ncbi:MAG: shikimate dehydrogenase [Alphaproteobacteria bacterium]|nr:shikimate dehydrogenase [Alphaproteobacteria bacterium]MCB9927948.1 shikimate dehydrogenase [Alphaproteobacteria bacterium]